MCMAYNPIDRPTAPGEIPGRDSALRHVPRRCLADDRDVIAEYYNRALLRPGDRGTRPSFNLQS